MTQFLQDKGTLHHLLCPYRHEQNFVVERKHRNLLNVARALMFQGNLPIKFWGDDVCIAAHEHISSIGFHLHYWKVNLLLSFNMTKSLPMSF